MQVNAKEASLKILANVEANERQLKEGIAKGEAQLKQVQDSIDAARGALKEVEVLKCMLIMVSTNGTIATSLESILETSPDPTEA